MKLESKDRNCTSSYTHPQENPNQLVFMEFKALHPVVKIKQQKFEPLKPFFMSSALACRHQWKSEKMTSYRQGFTQVSLW